MNPTNTKYSYEHANECTTTVQGETYTVWDNYKRRGTFAKNEAGEVKQIKYNGTSQTTSTCARLSPSASTSRASGSEGAKMNDEKLMQAVLVIDGALAGVLAFYSIPAALFMIALLVYAAIKF